MKVRELIERLDQLDPEMVVVIPLDRSGDFGLVERVGVDTIEIIAGKVSLAYPYEAGAREVVRLFDSDLDGRRSDPRRHFGPMDDST